MMMMTNDSSVCGSGGGSNYLRNVTTPTSNTSLLGSCGSSIGSSNSSFGGFPIISRLTGGTPTSTSNSILTTTSPQTQQQHVQLPQQPSPGSDVLNHHHTSPRGRSTSTTATPDDVVKSGYLRKMKGSRKFFVLRREVDADHPARLEYYVNDKLFKAGKPPRKTVALKTCFNISGTEKKGKSTINLHTKNDCVQISMSNEVEMNEWLKVMNTLAGQEEVEEELHVEGKSHFEHVWMVQALNKGLGSKANIIGPYRLQLTSKELALYKFGEHGGRNDIVRFPLNVIRNVSHDSTLGCFFHIELGRLAPTGPGQLSLKTDDNNITQNMHLLILKAMRNYSKEDVIPRERVRLDTWNSDSNSSVRSMHSTPPGMSRINSMDGSIRIRTDSVSSAVGGASQSNQGSLGMSPPVPIVGPTPSISFNSPICSTGTESASSSYSVDYDNNNHGIGGDHLQHEMYPKSNDEDESYVAWNPADDQQHSSLNSLGSLTLPLNQDMSDYVDTSIVSRDSTSSTAQTPSSYMEMQSPMSPFDNYLPMSPAGVANSGSSIKYNNGGKSSANHSRNSSLLEEMDGYVPMIPGGQYSRAESGAGSITGSANGLDENYLDMDLSRKLNISNDDICRASPASNESLPTNTPSSDFPLEKVMSYLTDDMEDSVRPLRAYSVGSRSDTSAINKSRLGRNRLEAVQENFRTRAMSVGSKNPRKPGMNMAAPSVPNGSRTMAPLSNSWSGSTGRWLPKFATSNSHNLANQQSYSPTGYTYNHSHAASESADSDLMELDFSKNKTRNRKRSLTNQVNNFISTTPPSGSTSQSSKLSHVPKGALGASLNEISPGSDASESSKICSASSPVVDGPPPGPPRNYASSAPISIQRNNKNVNDGLIYPDPNSSQALSTMLKGNNDLKQLNETDDETAYLDMDFTPNQKSKSEQVNSTGTVATKFLPGLSNFKPESPIKAPVVVTPKLAPYPGTKFSLYVPSSSSSLSSLTSPVKTAFSLTHEPASQLTRSLSSSSNISTTSNNSNSSSASCVSVKSQSVLSDSSSSTSVGKFLGSDTSATSLSVLPGLCRIEESPEKQHDSSKASSSGSVTPQSPSRHNPIGIPSSALNRIPSDDHQVTYAAIEHVPSACRQGYSSGSGATTNSCGSTSVTPNKLETVAYAQIDFVKTSEALKPKN